MRVYFTNLGCKLNQAELERQAREFSARGHHVVGDLGDANLHVVNTCTVTHRAAADSRREGRRGQRAGEGIRTVLTGCYVNSDPEEAARLAGVDLVVPNEEKDRLLDRIHAAFPGEVPERPGPDHLPYMPLEFGNARALVKIEDGCNMTCSFCIIPFTRGRQTSKTPESILEEVKGLVSSHEEIVLTGVQISSYQSGRTGLADLTFRLLEETAVRRIRLSSIAPWQFDPRLLDLLDTGRVCRHFHLSLQSGCDATLRRMRRPYTIEQYRDLLDSIRGRRPGTAITTDLILGFPGETEEEFAATLENVRSLRFARIHAFPYSPRTHTDAAGLPGQVSEAEKRARTKAMIEVGEESARQFRNSQEGMDLEVLWETRKEGVWSGMTDNYLRVQSRGPEEWRGRVSRMVLPRSGAGAILSRT